MKDRNKIIAELYVDPEIDKIINCFTKGNSHTEDLKGEIFLILCEMKKEKVVKAHTEGYIYYLIANIVRKQYYSTTSPFHRVYKKNRPLELFDNYSYTTSDSGEEIPSDVSTLNGIYNALEELGYVDKELFKMYYKIQEYNPTDGDKRDKKCTKATSSLRKIAANLNIGKEGEPITVSTYYSHKSINETLNTLKSVVKDKRDDDYTN